METPENNSSHSGIATLDFASEPTNPNPLSRKED